MKKPKSTRIGRPPSDKRGKHFWIPADLVPAVQAMIAARRQTKGGSK